MNLVLIFLIVAAISGYIADKKLDDNPDIGIPATAISLFCTVAGPWHSSLLTALDAAPRLA